MDTKTSLICLGCNIRSYIRSLGLESLGLFKFANPRGWPPHWAHVCLMPYGYMVSNHFPSKKQRYTVVYCGILWYTVVYCGILWYTVVYCGILWYTVVYCGILWYTVVYCYRKNGTTQPSQTGGLQRRPRTDGSITSSICRRWIDMTKPQKDTESRWFKMTNI